MKQKSRTSSVGTHPPTRAQALTHTVSGVHANPGSGDASPREAHVCESNKYCDPLLLLLPLFFRANNLTSALLTPDHRSSVVRRRERERVPPESLSPSRSRVRLFLSHLVCLLTLWLLFSAAATAVTAAHPPTSSRSLLQNTQTNAEAHTQRRQHRRQMRKRIPSEPSSLWLR